MKFRICALAATVAALLSTGSATAATSVVDEFASLCLASKTAAEAAEKARAAGYVTAPPELRARLQASLPGDGEFLWRTQEGEMRLFASALAKRAMANSATQAVSGELCMVGSTPPASDLKASVERLLNVGGEQVVGKSPTYVFEETPSGRVRLDASDKGLMGVKSIQGSVRLVGVSERSGMGAVMMMIPGVVAK